LPSIILLQVIHAARATSTPDRYRSVRSRPVVAAIALGLLLLLPEVSLCGGILHVISPSREGMVVAVARPTLFLSKAMATVSNSDIEYSLEQTFLNDNDLALDAMYIFPMPSPELVRDLELRIDGLPTPMSMVTASEFFPVLKSLILENRDPNLLTIAGKNVAVVRSLNLGARQQKKFSLRFRTANVAENDHLELVLRLDGERYCLGPVGEIEIDVRFKGSTTVRSLFSPTHKVMVFRESPERCMVSVREHGKIVRDDFRLLSTLGGNDLDVRVFSHKPPGQKGAFMAFVLPPLTSAKTTDLQKDVIFVLDMSGSMNKTYADLAKRAVVSGLEMLRRGDRFNVVLIGSQLRPMSRKLMDASMENITESVKFISSAEQRGGTDLHNALVDGLEQFSSRRRQAVLMLVGDGRPTVGVCDPTAIVEDVRKYNRAKAKLFVLAIGDRPDMALLDSVAVSAKGACVPITGEKQIGPALRTFMSIVAPPQGSDLSLTFEDVVTDHVLPASVTDLHRQDAALLLGRYDTHSDVQARVALKGMVQRRPRVVTKTVTFPGHDLNRPYILSIWAMRRMGELLDGELSRGSEIPPSQETQELSNRYGFRLPVGGQYKSPKSGTPPTAGNLDYLLWSLKRSSNPSDVEPSGVRRIDGKVFRWIDGAWTDTAYRVGMPSTIVTFMSDDYFEHVRKEEQLARFFALGPVVTVVYNGTAYAVR
jgi:hypothetical protein